MGSRSARLLNIGLRGATLGTRFLFIFFLAKYLDAASVGYYGLFTATVGYCLYFVGLDFYIYVAREILKAPIEQRGQLLKGQAALSAVLFVALIPLALSFLQFAGWPDYLAWWFFVILLLEYFNQEVSRLLIGLSEQISGSVILFFRQGSWAIAVVVLMTWDARLRHLELVMALWTCAGVAAAALGVWKLKTLNMGGWHLPLDWGWIKRGVSVSVFFLVATLALRAVQTFDRFWLEALGGIELVAAYVLLFGVAGTLMVFLDAGVFAYAYPALIRLGHAHDHDAARAIVWRTLLQTIGFCAAFSVVSWSLLPYLLQWIDKPAYESSIGMYPWLLLAMIVNAIGMVPHYALYARGRDKPIVYSHFAALLTFVLSTWALSKTYSYWAVPIGLNVAFTVILAWKAIAYWQLNRSNDKSKPAVQSA